MLANVLFSARSYRDAISQGLKEMLDAWNLKEEQQVCVTTDNAANIVKAVAINKWSRLQCFGHRLHLAIEHSLKDGRIDRALNVCKKVVGCFSYSWRRRRELSEAQKELKLPQHKLKTECPTRWGSKQAMIARVLEQQSAISFVLSADRTARHLVPTWQDVEVLEAVNNSLSPLAEFTDALSGEQYVSVSYVKPVLHLFNNKFLAEKVGETELSKCIKKNILDYLNEKFDDPLTQELLDMASAVDPRFKLKYVNENGVEAVKIRLRTEMASVSTVKPPPSVTVRVEADDQNAPALKKTKLWAASLKWMRTRGQHRHLSPMSKT
ncbi:zinc finger BED domain-containing protein 4-like isoform X1 [Xyrauchen texanus]|uniref:zinc finger BED domain-containing protein 4-like isoform X1 n=1 Tax=Xyrauchen texanus TaxID=154827 RepID=UPI002242C5C8|nr:zinc finger BED domain-containing protein 4-like isoform X1 [Xyrauchen texanus]